MQESQKARPWIAALLSLLLPGLGHAIVAEYRMAALAFLGTFALFTLGLSLTFGTIQGLIVTLGFAGLWFIAVAADAFRRARRAPARPQAWVTRWPVLLALGLAANLLVNLGLTKAMAHGVRFRVFEIVSQAMEPDLRVGDRIMANMGRGRGPIKLQDRVVMESPDDVHTLVVSRCVALAGDLVEIRDAGFYRNGVLQEQWTLSAKEQAFAHSGAFAPMFRYGPVRIPEGHCFCLGDNRCNAMDSRMWGPIREDAVQGKVLYTWLHAPKA